MTELVQKQIIFARYLAILLDEFPDYCFQLGDLYRSKEECERLFKLGVGALTSAHNLRLAIDVNVWVDGELLTAKRDYENLGEYWKELPKLYPEVIEVETCWGGEFTTRCDPYHFSIEHGGIR